MSTMNQRAPEGGILCNVPFELKDEQASAPDGAVKTQRLVLYSGDFNQEGAAGELLVSRDHLAQMAANFAAQGTDVFVTFGHAWELDGEPAAGWITGLSLTEDHANVPDGEVGLLADFTLLAATATSIKAGEFRYFSPTFVLDGTDEQGKAVGARMLSGSITNFPFLKGLGAFALAEINGVNMPTEAKPEDKPATLTLETLSASVKAVADTLLKLAESTEQKFTDMLATVKELTENPRKAAGANTDKPAAELSEAQGAVVKMAAQLKAQGETIEGMQAGLTKSALQSAVKLAEETGRLTPAMRDKMLPGFTADPLKALADSTMFSSVRQFTEFVAAAEPVISFKDRASSDATLGENGSTEGLVTLSDADARAAGFPGSKDETPSQEFLKYQRKAQATNA